MLSAACIHIVEDGIGLENKSRRQGAAPFTLICNLHKIVDTIIGFATSTFQHDTGGFGVNKHSPYVLVFDSLYQGA